MANNRGDIALHVNPRVHERQLILNSAPAGAWGTEERKPLTISTGEDFTFIIMVTEQGYKVRFSIEKIIRSILQNIFPDCRQQPTYC